MREQTERGAALTGLRVVECGAGVSAPFCARLLADLGADVIKVELPEGDPSRRLGPFPNGRPNPEQSALFAFLNGGKRSLLLPGDGSGDLLSSVVSSADVLITNLDPVERGAWHLDLNAVAAANPALITVTLSPFGESGPLSGRRAYEINVCALSGVSVILGEPGRPPLSFPFDVPALQAGMHGAAAALAAVLARSRSRRGQRIDIAEADVLAYYTGGMALFIVASGGKWARRGFERHGAIYPSGFYPCGDGYIFMATQTRAQWQGFLRLMGDPDWARQDPALSDGVAIGWKRAGEVDARFIPWLVEHTRRELLEMAGRENLVLGPINTVGDLVDEPHLAARHFWTDATLNGTTLKLPGMGYRMSATPWRIGASPRLGEHTSEIVASLADQRETPLVTEVAPSDSREAKGHTPGEQRPLAGYRAIEFGFNWAGPLVGQILADLGVEVIKVETRTRLDFMRHWHHARAFFHNANRGKLSIAVNVKHREGVDLILKLAAQADLVVDNFAAGVMARNGLGYEALRAVKPDLVVLSMAMAGQDGPLRHLRGFATIATGFAGLESSIGYPDTGPTGLPTLGLGDANAAIQAVLASLAALQHRERTGQGQFIDLSQIEASTTLMAEPLLDFQLGARDHGPQANHHGSMAPHGIYPAAGTDRWVALAIGSDAEWTALVRFMGEPAWACDESLANAAGRLARWRELDEQVAGWTAGHERDALAEDLQAAGIAATPVLELVEMINHPHFRARGLGRHVANFEGKDGFVYDTPWHFQQTSLAVQSPSPKLGEHNERVFGGILGMSDDEIGALVERKVLW